jgi:hypothetical protein
LTVSVKSTVGLCRSRESLSVRLAVGWQFSGRDGNGVCFGFSIRLRHLGRIPSRTAGDDETPPHRGRFCLDVFPPVCWWLQRLCSTSLFFAST